MPYATIEDMEAQLGFSTDNTGNIRPTTNRLKRMLFRADDIIHAELQLEDNFLVEKSKITVDYSALSGAEYFNFYITDTNAGEAEHYIWFNTGADSDPSASGTAHECDISSVSTDRGLAEAIVTTINAIDGIRAWSKNDEVYLENFEMFNATDTVDGDTGFTFSTEQDGSDDSGACKNIAIELVIMMINNMFSFTNPDKYALKNVELTKDHIRTLHKTYYAWSADTFDLGM